MDVSGAPSLYIYPVPSREARWWHAPLLAVIAIVAIAETWGAVSLSKMVHRASNMQFTNGVGFATNAVKAAFRPDVSHVVRTYPSVILGEMIQVVGLFQQSTIQLTLLASPSKIEQKIASDYLAGNVRVLLVDAYIGAISDLESDPNTGTVTVRLIDMKVDDNATPPSMFYPLQHASSFQGTTNGTVVTTLFGT